MITHMKVKWRWITNSQQGAKVESAKGCPFNYTINGAGGGFGDEKIPIGWPLVQL